MDGLLSACGWLLSCACPACCSHQGTAAVLQQSRAAQTASRPQNILLPADLCISILKPHLFFICTSSTLFLLRFCFCDSPESSLRRGKAAYWGPGRSSCPWAGRRMRPAAPPLQPMQEARTWQGSGIVIVRSNAENVLICCRRARLTRSWRVYVQWATLALHAACCMLARTAVSMVSLGCQQQAQQQAVDRQPGHRC